MRKKILFAGVALTTLFAACSNEEIFNEQVVVGQENRPMTEVALSFNEENVSLGLDAETRSYFGVADGGYQWIFEDEDRIGGLLMDEWNGKGCGIENFTLTDYVHTNYAFIRETGADGKTKWVTPENAPVCEGNYFFYFPYNDTFTHRGHVAWHVNPRQNNYDDNGNYWPMQAIKDNQKWIGYKWVGHDLEGKVNKVNFDFVPLFAMPAFDIINKAGDLKVDSLVVRVTSNRSNNQIDLNGTHDLMATTMVLAPSSRGFDQVNQIWEGEKDANNNWVPKTYAWHQSQMWYHAQAYTDFGYDESYKHPVADPDYYKYDKDAEGKNLSSFRWKVGTKPVFPINKADNEIKDYMMRPTYEYTAVFKNYKVKQFGHIQAMLVMPAGIYAYGQDETFEALLYVTSEEGDEYVVRIDLGKPQTQGGTNNSAHDDVNSAAANKFLKAGQITKFTADFDASAMQSYNITDFKVTDSDNLKWVVEKAIDSNKGDNGIYDLNITTTGKRTKLTSDIEKLLNERPNVRLHINGEITIDEGTTENAINLLWFNNPNMKTKLNILNKQVKKVAKVVDPTTGLVADYDKLNNCSTITIEEGGELNTTAVTVEAITVINKGIFTATDVIAENMVNSGDATAEEIDVTSSSDEALKNTGKLVVNTIEGNLYNYGNAKVVNGDVVRNAGEMKLNNSKSFSNKVNGTLELLGGTITDNAVNRGGKVIVSGATTFTYGRNDGGVLDVKAALTIEFNYKNYNDEHLTVATINIKEAGKVCAIKGNVENFEDAVINVEGNIAHNVQNSGEIFVKNNGQVVVDGVIAEATKGIIDVTEAYGVANDAQKAMDMKTGDNGNHFRYVIKASTDAGKLQEALNNRISSQNYKRNLITIVFEGEDEIKYYGRLSTEYLVYHVLVKEGTTVVLEGGKEGEVKETWFKTLSNNCLTQEEYKAFEVESTAKVIVSDYAKLVVNDGVEVYVDGTFYANGQSELAGKATVYGAGEIWGGTANNTWTKAAAFTGEYHGNWINI